VNFAVPITNQEAEPIDPIVEVHQQVAGRLRHPLAGRVRGNAGQVHSPPIELDDEQHIQPGQPDRLHGQKVAGQHPAGLGRAEK
jgi:hypothetical protein